MPFVLNDPSVAFTQTNDHVCQGGFFLHQTTAPVHSLQYQWHEFLYLSPSSYPFSLEEPNRGVQPLIRRAHLVAGGFA